MLLECTYKDKKEKRIVVASHNLLKQTPWYFVENMTRSSAYSINQLGLIPRPGSTKSLKTHGRSAITNNTYSLINGSYLIDRFDTDVTGRGHSRRYTHSGMYIGDWINWMCRMDFGLETTRCSSPTRPGLVQQERLAVARSHLNSGTRSVGGVLQAEQHRLLRVRVYD